MVWTRAARCRAWLRERLPARESRWRRWSPLETSIGGGAGVAGVAVGVGEAGDVAGVAEDLGGQDLADAEDLGERAARRGDRFGAPAAVVDEGPVDASDVRDQLARHCLAFDVDGAGALDRG